MGGVFLPAALVHGFAEGLTGGGITGSNPPLTHALATWIAAMKKLELFLKSSARSAPWEHCGSYFYLSRTGGRSFRLVPSSALRRPATFRHSWSVLRVTSTPRPPPFR